MLRRSEAPDPNSINQSLGTIKEESEKTEILYESSESSNSSSSDSDISDNEILERMGPEQMKKLINKALSKDKLKWENLNLWDKVRLFDKW